MEARMEPLEATLKAHPFLEGLPQEHINFIVGCTTHKVFKEGEVILKEGEAADKFYIIRSGKVAIYIGQEHNEIIIQTIGGGEILGWSWLIPPYSYRFSAKAVENTRVLALDGKCLREKCEKNPDLGYLLLKRLVVVFAQRLEAARLQLLDIYHK